MTVLVTGATGFVGSAVTRRLLAAGERVRVLVRPASNRALLDGLDVASVTGDLCDPPSLARAVQGCTAVFHVAADYRLWAPDADILQRINVEGTRHLMTAALRAGVPRVVYTSSVATLGLHADGRPADEDTPAALENMVGAYKRSKYLAERIVADMVRDAGLPAVIVHPSAPVGPRDAKPTPTGRMVLDAARGQVPAFVDTGLNVVHVDDVAMGHWLAWRYGVPGRRYILGGDNLRLDEIYTIIAGLVARRPPRIRLPISALVPVAWLAEGVARLSGRAPLVTLDGLRMARKRMFFTSRRAEQELGYSPRPAHAALADAVAWYGATGRLKGSC